MSHKEKLKRAYGKIGKAGGYRRNLWPDAMRFLKSLKPSTILDIGSGNAHYTKDIEALGHKIIISDFSKEQLIAARKLGINNPAAVLDATQLAVKSSKFKVVTAFAVLHHMSNQEERQNFLKEVKRVLKVEGQAFLSVIKARKGGFDADVPFAGVSRYYHFFSKKELTELLEQSDFKEYNITSSDSSTEKEVIIDGVRAKLKLGNYFIKIKK